MGPSQAWDLQWGKTVSLNRIWEAVEAASAAIDREQIKTLTNSMDWRLMKGGHTGTLNTLKGHKDILFLYFFYFLFVY